MINPLRSVGFTLATVVAPHAQVVVHDAGVVPGPGGVNPNQAIIGLTQSIPLGQGACGFFFDSVFDENTWTTSTRVTGAFIAEIYQLYVVTPGTRFDAEYVASHSPVAGNTASSVPYIIPYEDGQTTLFAYWDDRLIWAPSNTPNEPDSFDYYGWMEIAYSTHEDATTGQPVISWTVLDSATALGGGIIVGTYTQVPEPSAAAALLGAISLAYGVVGKRRRVNFASLR